MKTAILKNIITGVEKRVHLTMDHPAVQCGIAVWVDDEGKAYSRGRAQPVLRTERRCK